ncbi:MAG: ATP-binding protein, partial [Candidatus Dojkabacteria bacterium]
MILDKKSIAGLIPSRRIKRTIARNLFEHIMKRGEVTVLYGARQVGKSTLILSCLEEYCNQGGNIFYFNLDYDLQDFITDPTEFIAYIESKKNTQNTMIFIDEAQRLENIGLFVKYIYDRKLQYKFILSGSASLDIQSKVKEPLTGRKKEFYLGSLTLSEILTFKGYNTEAITGSFPQLQTILEDYLLYGGYPQVFLSATKEDKVEKLEEISESYVLRDLS